MSDEYYCTYCAALVSIWLFKEKNLLTMYPNSILDSLAWMMDHSPQKKWDAKAYLQIKAHTNDGDKTKPVLH